MKDVMISESVIYVGVDDKTIDLFESQYPVPNGVSYNSYVILDDKLTVMDTVDARATDEWFANLEKVIGDKDVSYLVVSHMNRITQPIFRNLSRSILRQKLWAMQRHLQ